MTYRPLLILVALLISALPGAAAAQSSAGCTGGSGSATIALDGEFGDWAGRPCVPDPPDDCRQERADITAVSFGTNPSAGAAYFMLQRSGMSFGPITYYVFIDRNNNGSYSDSADRVLMITYQPHNGTSRVDVYLLTASGSLLSVLAYDEDYGDSREEGGLRVEFGVTFAQLGISAGQAIRFIAGSYQGNSSSLCDISDEVQWSPASALGLLLLAGVAVGGAAVLARRRARLVAP